MQIPTIDFTYAAYGLVALIGLMFIKELFSRKTKKKNIIRTSKAYRKVCVLGTTAMMHHIIVMILSMGKNLIVSMPNNPQAVEYAEIAVKSQNIITKSFHKDYDVYLMDISEIDMFSHLISQIPKHKTLIEVKGTKLSTAYDVAYIAAKGQLNKEEKINLFNEVTDSISFFLENIR